jgi:hypothetical protein
MENKQSNLKNLEMIEGLILRIKKELDAGKTTCFEFNVLIKKGVIERIDYFSSYKINFDNLTSG